MDLKNCDLISLQTEYMKKDRSTQALCAALSPETQKIAEEIINCLIYANVDNLSEEVLDELAWQFKVDWYNNQAGIDSKRLQIKNALRIHMIKGTPKAVEDSLSIAFDVAHLEEWFDYGGTPGHFKISTEDRLTDERKLSLFLGALRSVKRFTAVLDKIEIQRNVIARASAGCTLRITRTYKISAKVVS